MTTSKQASRVRWECPSGAHPAVLGSRRPPRDATVRYCLPCSQQSGRLVTRVAPALERARAAKAERTTAKVKQQRDRERTQAGAKYIATVIENGQRVPFDAKAALDAILKLPEISHWRLERGLTRPKMTVRRRSDNSYSGHAHSSGSIVVSIGDVSRETAEVLLLHEVTHWVLPSGVSHGSTFRNTLLRAARQHWPGINVKNAGSKYTLDKAIMREAERLAAGASDHAVHAD